jgi:FtsP/CotA-like multicopper oxidase with cupredoxin domain
MEAFMNKHSTSRLAGWLGAACAVGALALAGNAEAKIVGATGTNFILVAKAGYISAADGGSIYNWGYAIGSGTDCTQAPSATKQYPGPTLIVEQNTVVTVTLCNQLPTRVSVMFPGQSGVTASGGTQGKVAMEAAPGGSVTYTFTAANPGTYMYQSGTQMQVQVEMGLFGAMVVRPAGAPQQAYGHAGTRFDREHLQVLSEIDPNWHHAVDEQVRAVLALATPPANWMPDTASFAPRNPLYWFINGRTAPDTMLEDGSEHLPAQPYSGFLRMHPGERLLMRVVNAGRDLHPYHHHGNNTWTVAVDGRMLASGPATGPDLARSDNTLRMVPGQTVDAIYEWTGKGLGWDVYGLACNSALVAPDPASCDVVYANYATQLGVPVARLLHQDPSDRGRPLPTVIPSALEMTFGDMYSGSPFLGATGNVPVGAGKLGSGGAYFHMIHSHNEREIINYGVFPGGMMTMVIIEPWTTPLD